MFNKALAVVVMVTFVVSADATITASGTETWGQHEPEPVNGTGGGWGDLPIYDVPYYNFRLMVHVTDSPGGGEDDWTAAGLDVALSGPVHFYQHAVNDTDPPDPLFFAIPGFEDSEYTSYFTSPGDYPNTAFVGGVLGFPLRNETPTELQVDFFDTIDTGNGDWYLVSLTVVPDDPDDPVFCTGENWSGEGVLYYSGAHSGALFDYSFTIPPIPEPGGLALLGLGVLAMIRRR